MGYVNTPYADAGKEVIHYVSHNELTRLNNKSRIYESIKKASITFKLFMWQHFGFLMGENGDVIISKNTG